MNFSILFTVSLLILLSFSVYSLALPIKSRLVRRGNGHNSYFDYEDQPGQYNPYYQPGPYDQSGYYNQPGSFDQSYSSSSNSYSLWGETPTEWVPQYPNGANSFPVDYFPTHSLGWNNHGYDSRSSNEVVAFGPGVQRDPKSSNGPDTSRPGPPQVNGNPAPNRPGPPQVNGNPAPNRPGPPQVNGNPAPNRPGPPQVNGNPAPNRPGPPQVNGNPAPNRPGPPQVNGNPAPNRPGPPQVNGNPGPSRPAPPKVKEDDSDSGDSDGDDVPNVSMKNELVPKVSQERDNNRVESIIAQPNNSQENLNQNPDGDKGVPTNQSGRKSKKKGNIVSRFVKTLLRTIP